MNLNCHLLIAAIALSANAGLADGQTTDKEPAGIYCKLSSGELRERLGELRADFVMATQAVDELESGYRYWFEKSSDRLRKLADFVHFESECCPFLNFEISLEGESEKVALSLTGREGTKEFLDAFAEMASFDMKAVLEASSNQP